MLDRIVVINDLAEPKGGATALALEGALTCRARGIPVTFLSGDGGNNPVLADRGVECVALGGARLRHAGPLRALAGGLYNATARAMVGEWIARHDTPATVYHVHGWAQILSPSIFAAMRPVADRVVLHAHDFFLACPNGSFSFLRTGTVCPLAPLSAACVIANCDRHSYAHKLWRVARQIMLNSLADLRHASSILIIHDAMRPFLRRAGIPDRSIETVPNPVRPFSRTRIEAERNRDLLFVGRLEATKGPDLAAMAARRVGVTIRFVGDGEMRAALERDYPEMIFTGRLPPDEIGAQAAHARALVMPSRYPEPYGLVAAEALWSGLPVIATDTAFLTGDIVAAGAGHGVDPRDTAAFATVLRAVADDDQAVRAQSEAAFDRTRALGLTPDGWADRLIEAYERRISGARLRVADAA